MFSCSEGPMDGRRRTEIWKEELIGSQKREDGKEGAEMDKRW